MSSSLINWLGIGRLSLTNQLLIGFAILCIAYYLIAKERPIAGIPIVTVSLEGWKKWLPQSVVWKIAGKEIHQKGIDLYPSPFQVLTGSGYRFIIQNKFAEEIKNHPDLSLIDAHAKELFIHYPGFDGPRAALTDEHFVQGLIKTNLTQSLSGVTDDLVEETSSAIFELFGEHDEWRTYSIREDMLHVVARQSARVFLGRELCRDEKWLDISKKYTHHQFRASAELRSCPDLLRPLLFWFLPSCRSMVREVRYARKFIMPEVRRREQLVQKAVEQGDKLPRFADSLGWIAESANGREVDYVGAQLALTTAAVHTTSETALRCIVQLCETPEAVEPLREEMRTVLKTNGWSKNSLYKMKVLDSFLKEVQRMNRLSTVSMNRMVKTPIKLSDGTILPTGSVIMVSDDRAVSEDVYPHASTFDHERFFRLRAEPGKESQFQFATPTPEHMGFGYGRHACPGRFFAASEIKIALCLLLLQYDFQFVPELGRPKELEFETMKLVDPAMKIQMRKRKLDMDLMDPLDHSLN